MSNTVTWEQLNQAIMGSTTLTPAAILKIMTAIPKEKRDLIDSKTLGDAITVGYPYAPKHQLDLYSKIRRKSNLESSISNGYSDYTTQLVTVNQNDFI